MTALLLFDQFAIMEVLHFCMQLQIFLLFLGIYLFVLPKSLGYLGVWDI